MGVLCRAPVQAFRTSQNRNPWHPKGNWSRVLSAAKVTSVETVHSHHRIDATHSDDKGNASDASARCLSSQVDIWDPAQCAAAFAIERALASKFVCADRRTPENQMAVVDQTWKMAPHATVTLGRRDPRNPELVRPTPTLEQLPRESTKTLLIYLQCESRPRIPKVKSHNRFVC